MKEPLKIVCPVCKTTLDKVMIKQGKYEKELDWQEIIIDKKAIENKRMKRV